MRAPLARLGNARHKFYLARRRWLVRKSQLTHPYRLFYTELKLYFGNHVVARIPFHGLRLAYYRRAMRYDIGKGSSIHLGAYFYGLYDLRMGKNSVVNGQCLIDPRGGLDIGDNVSISMRCAVLTADHDPASPLLETRMKGVTIEDAVFVGTGATILPGVRLGYACVVAAGAVVTKDVEPYAIVAGIPAKRLGTRAEPAEGYSSRYDRIFH